MGSVFSVHGCLAPKQEGHRGSACQKKGAHVMVARKKREEEPEREVDVAERDA